MQGKRQTALPVSLLKDVQKNTVTMLSKGACGTGKEQRCRLALANRAPHGGAGAAHVRRQVWIYVYASEVQRCKHV